MADTASVIVLRPHLCSECVHVVIRREGLTCDLFREPVVDETADDCLGFEREP